MSKTKAKTSAAAAKTATKTLPGKPSGGGNTTAKTFVLYGADEYSRPRAAYFVTRDPAPLAKAANAMNLRMVEVTGPDLSAIAKQLPAGRIHASGTGFVPFIKGDLYAELAMQTAGEQQPAPRPQTTPAPPRSWDDVAPGHLVIVQETRECGWWEAIVVERNGDLVTVRYRDYPAFPNLIRHRSAVALIGTPAAAEKTENAGKPEQP